MIKKVFILSVLLFLTKLNFAQIKILQFEGNLKIKSEIDSALRHDVKKYDLIIAYGISSTWDWRHEYHLLVVNNGHFDEYYYKNFTKRYPNYNPDSTLKLKPSPQQDCNKLYNHLISDSLFFINDDSVYLNCPDGDTIINGKKYKYRSASIFDAALYNIVIIDHKHTRLLYFYAPDFFYSNCPSFSNRKYALKIIDAMEKEW